MGIKELRAKRDPNIYKYYNEDNADITLLQLILKRLQRLLLFLFFPFLSIVVIRSITIVLKKELLNNILFSVTRVK